MWLSQPATSFTRFLFVLSLVAFPAAYTDVLGPAPAPTHPHLCIYNEPLHAFLNVLDITGADTVSSPESFTCPDGGSFDITNVFDKNYSLLLVGDLNNCTIGNVTFDGDFTDVAGMYREDKMFSGVIGSEALDKTCDISILDSASTSTFCGVRTDLILEDC